MRALGERALSLGADPADSPDERVRKALLVGISLMVLPAGVLWGGLYWAFGERIPALFPWGYTLASVLCLLVFARTRSYRFLRFAELLMIVVTPALLLLALGGLAPSSGVILWSLVAPLGTVVFDRSRAWAWYVAFVALLAVTIPLAPVVRPEEADMPEGAVRAFAALNIAAVSLVAFTLLVTFARQREAAQGRVESLLLNILPHEIAQRLQAEPQAIADHFDEASILFADVVDFTPLSSRLDAREIVGFLDRLFTAFDELADRYGVEKIKTIGDCLHGCRGSAAGAGGPRPRARPDGARDA
ncbi:MAG: adenylate/guanylate cyclase domain-containing protein [Gaiellaceae bacterium]